MSADLFKAAQAALENCHAPYSDFPVGAALRTPSGNIYAGCNVENASFPEGWCAETSAIAHMVTAGEKGISEILVMAPKKPRITPCGGCRQRIAEFGTPDTAIHLCDADGIIETLPLSELLPNSFALEKK